MTSEAHLLPQDPVLPHLPRLFDTDYMARRLHKLLGAAAAFEACAIERVKYRPRRACVVGYKLRCRDGHEQRFALGMYSEQDAGVRYQKARAQAPIGQNALPAVALLPRLNALVWTFPYDRKLSALALLADGARVAAQCLPSVVRERWGESWRTLDSQHTVVSYFPEHTCTVSVKITLATVLSDREHAWTLFGKTRYDDAGKQTYQHMRALWDSDARRRGLIGYARALGYDPAQRLLWQEGVSGVTLDSELAASDAAELLERVGAGMNERSASGLIERVGAGMNQRSTSELLERVGAAVGALHATPVAAARTLGAADIAASLQRAQQVLAAALAPGESAVGAAVLLAQLQRSAANVDFSPYATLHGDLHSKNILVCGTQVSLIDFDRLARGPALAELGGLLAELIYRACVARSELDWSSVGALIGGYQRAVPWRVDAQQLAWCTAAALLHERAYRCVTSLKPGRMQALPHLLCYARDILSGAIRLPGAVRAARSSSGGMQVHV